MFYKFIGWCHEDNHDKVWGVIMLEDVTNSSSWSWTNKRCCIFWGRRGKKLQTKLSVDDRNTYNLIQSKKKKGYIEINSNKLNKVYPEFENDLEKTAVYAILKS